MAVVCLIISLLADLYLMTVVCIGVLVVSLGTRIWARAGVNHLAVTLKLDGNRTFPGDTVLVSLTVENNKVLPVSLKIELPSSGGEPHIMESALLSYGNLQCDQRLVFDHRGVYTIGPVHVAAYDLLGFYSVEKDFAQAQELVVYPHLIPLRDYTPLSREYFGNLASTAFVQDPVLVTGTREYSFQSPARNIHWKSSARTMILQEKMYAPSTHIKSMLFIDVEGFQKAEAAAEFEIMLKTAASFTVTLAKKNIFPGLMVNGVLAGGHSPILLPVENGQDIHLLLENLARLQMEFNPDYGRIIEEQHFTGNVSYTLFCYAWNEKLNWLSDSSRSLDIITFQEHIPPPNRSGTRIYNIYDCIDMENAGEK